MFRIDLQTSISAQCDKVVKTQSPNKSVKLPIFVPKQVPALPKLGGAFMFFNAILHPRLCCMTSKQGRGLRESLSKAVHLACMTLSSLRQDNNAARIEQKQTTKTQRQNRNKKNTNQNDRTHAFNSMQETVVCTEHQLWKLMTCSMVRR